MVLAPTQVDTVAGKELVRLQLLRDLFAAAPNEETLQRLNEQAGHDEVLPRLARASRQQSPEVLAAEWMRLFEGPGRFPVVLFGSYYLDGGKLMGPSTLATRQFYRRYGMEPVANVPADHLALELGMLGYFTASAAMAEAGERQRFLAARSEFIQGFMLPWITKMVEVLGESTSCRFFSELGHVLVSAILEMQ